MTGEIIEATAAKPLIKYGWLRALLFIISALIVTAIFTSVAVTLLAIANGIALETLATNARDLIRDLGLPSNIIISLFGFIGMLTTAFLFRRYIDKKSFISLGFQIRGFLNDAIIGLILGGSLITLGFVILTFFDIISIQSYSLDWGLLSGYLVFFSIGSLNEEIMIRGYFLSNLMESMNKYMALFVSSFLFAVMHLANAHVTYLSFINIFLAGMVLGIYYIHVRNLWLPIALHFSWNYFQGPVFGFEVSGVDIKGIITQVLSGDKLLTGGDFGFEGSAVATIVMISAIIFLHLKYRRTDKEIKSV